VVEQRWVDALVALFCLWVLVLISGKSFRGASRRRTAFPSPGLPPKMKHFL